MRGGLLAWSFGPTKGTKGTAAALDAALRAGGRAPARWGVGDATALRSAVFAEPPAALVLLGTTPQDVLSVRALRVPIVWDATEMDAAAAIRLREDECYRAMIAQVLARVDAVAQVGLDFRLAVEDCLQVGLSPLTLSEAFAQLDYRVAVAVGSGLGNMLNAAPMIRWIAERIGRRVTVIIHGDLAQGVQLFAGALYVDIAYPGFDYTVGRHYDVLVQTSLAAHMEPLCSATHWIQQHKLYDFNLHGRFVREADVFFMGLEPVFGPVPVPGGPLPLPFVRDLCHAPEHDRVIGIANGIKRGIWAKRQWDKTQELCTRLAAEGWTLRCFGMPEELVPGTEDFTGLTIRDTAVEIARCAYFIGHDGGMCHLAEKVGVPVAWLFGPTGRLKNGRWFEQSEMIISGAACSPCNFKLDWLRCADPVCMTDISVEDALAGFARVREKTARLGPVPVWAPVDPVDIAQEVASSMQPGRAPGDLREAAERALPVPLDGTATVRILTHVLRAGDLRGAAELSEALVRLEHPEPLVQELAYAIRLLNGASPGAVEPRRAVLALDGLISLGLAPSEMRASVEAIAHGQLTGGRPADVPDLFERMTRRLTGPLSNWALRRWVRTLATISPQRFTARVAELAVNSRGNREVTAFIRRATQEAAVVKEWNLLRDGAPPSVPLAPGRAGLPSLASPPVTLSLPTGPLILPRWSTVALLAPAVDPTVRHPGSASNLVVWMARSLAQFGLCPMVVSMSQATDRPSFDLRDNVTYVNGCPTWSAATWKMIVDASAPRLVIGLDGVEEAMGLANGALTFGLQGLYDRKGLAALIGDELMFDVRQISTDRLTPFDVLLAAFPYATPVQAAPATISNGTIALLVNDHADFDLAMHIVRRCPDLHFLVVADIIERGAELNVTYLLRQRVTNWPQVSEEIIAIVQPARHIGNLTMEALEMLRRGSPVLAATNLAGCTELPPKIFAPKKPDLLEDWVDALRLMLANQNGKMAT